MRARARSCTLTYIATFARLGIYETTSSEHIAHSLTHQQFVTGHVVLSGAWRILGSNLYCPVGL